MTLSEKSKFLKRLDSVQSVPAEFSEDHLLLQVLVGDVNEWNRCWALEKLREIGSSRDYMRFQLSCSDPSWVVRNEAMEGLAELRGKRCAPLLRRLAVKDKHFVNRGLALIILAEVSGATETPLIRKCIEKTSYSHVKISGLFALLHVGEFEAIDQIVTYMSEGELWESELCLTLLCAAVSNGLDISGYEPLKRLVKEFAEEDRSAASRENAIWIRDNALQDGSG